MEKNRNIKYVVKVIYITKPLQKIHFTVRHPENALYLSGIKVSTSNIRSKSVTDIQRQADTTGFLSLAIPQAGDVFYIEEVKSEIPDYARTVRRELSEIFVRQGLSTTKKTTDYFDTCVLVTEALMEGFYEDTVNTGRMRLIQAQAGSIGTTQPKPLYKITLYLRYQMTEKKEP